MKLKLLFLTLIVVLLCGCNRTETNYLDLGYSIVFELKDVTSAFENINVTDEKTYDFESNYSSANYALNCEIVHKNNTISTYDELLNLFDGICVQEYSQKMLDEKGLINCNNKIYYAYVDILLDFYSYDKSNIVSYDINENIVIYNCEAYRTDEEGNIIDTLCYTFSIKKENDVWKIYDCDYDGYCNYKLLCNTLSE